MTDTLKAYLALLAAMCALAFSAIFVRWADMPGMSSATYRVLIALVAMAPLFATRVRRLKQRGENPLPRRAVIIALAAGVWFAGDLGTWNTAVNFTNAANATLFGNTAPIYVSLGSLLMFGDRLGRRFWIGLLLSLAGAVLILGEDFGNGGGFNQGDLLALVTGVFYGLYQLTISRARLRGMDSLVASWLSNVSSVAVLLVLALAMGFPLTGFSLNQWGALAGLGLLSQAFGYVAINYAFGKIPAPLASATLLGQPILTAILSIPLLGEGVSTLQLMGGLATLVGIYLVNQDRRRQQPVPQPALAAQPVANNKPLD